MSKKDKIIINPEEEIQRQYSNITNEISRIQERIKVDTHRIKSLKKDQSEIMAKAENNDIYNIDFTNKWVKKYENPQSPEIGATYYDFITKMGPLQFSVFGSFYRECEAGVSIEIVSNKFFLNDKNETKQIRIRKKDSTIIHLPGKSKIVSEADVKLAVKLAMLNCIADINSVINHKMIFNIKELDNIDETQV